MVPGTEFYLLEGQYEKYRAVILREGRRLGYHLVSIAVVTTLDSMPSAVSLVAMSRKTP